MKLFISVFIIFSLSSAAHILAKSTNGHSIENLSKNAFRWAQFTAKRFGDKPVDKKWAEKLKIATLADNQVDESEQKLFSCLLDDECTNVRISAKKSLTFTPDDVVFNNTITDDAKLVIESISPKHYDDPLEAKLHSGNKGFASLVQLYNSSNSNKQKVIEIFADYFGDCWDKSSYKDGYSYFMSCINKEKAKAAALHGKDYRTGKQMIYQGVLLADMRQASHAGSGAIPDKFYVYLNSKEE